jgi:excisionase family DNA binding protein
MNFKSWQMQNVILSSVSIPDLVDLIACEIETRLHNRERPTPTPEPQRLYGDRSAAQYLGCTPLTIQKLRKSGEIPYYRYGRKFYFITSELDQTLKVSARKFGKHQKTT